MGLGLGLLLGLGLGLGLQRRVGSEDARRARAGSAASGGAHRDQGRVRAAVGPARVRGGGGALRDALTNHLGRLGGEVEHPRCRLERDAYNALRDADDRTLDAVPPRA